jgi:hypothetical protein
MAAVQVMPDQSNFQKVSNISIKRAVAANPMLQHIMTEKFRAFFKQLYEKGILPSELPAAHQCYSGDEIGLPPNGAYAKTFSLGRRTRLFRICTGEKNPFWVTVLFFTCADGTVKCKPTIIHQGGTDNAQGVQ